MTQCLSTNGPLPLQGVQARGRVVGRMLEMQLEQRYRNPEDVNVEVVYTFPLPWHAVLLGLEVELNGETLSGVVKARTQARADYEDALEDGDSAVLVTVNPDRTHTLELGNLLPGETCVVRLRYVQPLQPQQGSLRLLLPTTLAPRYGDPVRDGGYEPHAVPQVDPTAEYPFDIRLDIEGELARAAIGSPSHPVTLRTLSGVSGTVVQVALGRTAWLDRDFVLVFDGIGQASHGLAAWDRLDPGLGVVMAGLTPLLPNHEALPVTLKVLVDCSGSMAGDSIQAARRALQRILQALQTGDRFSLSCFGSTVEHRSRSLWRVTPATLASGRRWVERLDADMGGTEMRLAILSTLQLGSSNARDGAGEGPAAQADVLLITDGEIEAIEDVVATARHSHQRFFVVGIGASVAEGLLRRLAETTGGSCEFVAPGEDVEPAILRLFHRMRAPKVLHARIEWPTGCTVHAEGDLPRSLFAGDDVTVLAWLRASSAEALCGPVRLYGRIAGAESEMLLAELQPHFIADEPNTLARLAAHQRYQQLRRAGADAPAVLRQQLPLLAEKYQLVTEDTSLVLIQQRAEGQQAQSMPELRPVKGMLAAGWGGHGSVEFGMDKPNYLMAPSPRLAQMRFGIDLPATPALRGSTANRAKKLRAFLDNLVDDGPMRGPAASPEDEQSVIQTPEDKPEFWTTVDDDTEGVTWTAYEGLTPAGFLEWLRLNPQIPPATFEALRQTGLPAAVVEWLEFVVGEQAPEAEVVAAFLQVMVTQHCTFVQTEASVLGRLSQPQQPVSDAVLEAVRSALASMTDTEWPQSVLNYAEVGEGG
ncbi:MAG: VIT and VWA domain-containing protein [Tepidimonas sp.]|nr:VIT and VWA domain-containing protein [Tepidimonas sp.]